MQPFPYPSNTTYKIWLRLANWLQRYSSLKVWTTTTEVKPQNVDARVQVTASRLYRDLRRKRVEKMYSKLTSSKSINMSYRSILNKQRNFTCIFSAIFVWTEMTLCNLILCLNTKTYFPSSENEYHDESYKIKVYRIVWFNEGLKFENAISRCTLKARISFKWFKFMCKFPFLDYYWIPFCKQNVQTTLVIEAHRLEYRPSGRFTPTFTVSVDDPIDNINWCTAIN